MKRTKFTESQIVKALKENAQGRKVEDICRELGIHKGTFYNWRAKYGDNSADMIAATPANIDIYYILAERSREYYGEGYRWYDLIRTQKWEELASTYEIAGSNKGDHTAETISRTIEPHHYLRPIPQGQIELMEMSPEDKAAYQNPEY